MMIFTAIMNRLRGWDSRNRDWNNWLKLAADVATSKYVVAIYIGLLVWMFAPAWVAAVVAVGLGIKFSAGLGDYWDGSDKLNDEVRFIDRFVIRFLPSGYYNDMLSMSLRAWVFALPMIVALSFYNPWSAVLGLLFLLEGPIYLVMKAGSWRKAFSDVEYAHRAAELTTGALVLGGYLQGVL